MYRGKYISVCLKNGEFHILRRFVPETLFYSTNLPLIKVRPRGERSLILESPDIALTYLIPGRVTFRYGRKGHLIPVRNPPDLKLISLIGLEYCLDKCESSPLRYTHELMYVLKKLNIPSNSLRCFELREVYPHVFRPWDVEDPEISKDFGRFAYSVEKGSMYDAIAFIKKHRPKAISQLSSKTVAYPRIGAFITGELDRLYYDQRYVYLPHLGAVYRRGSNVIRYVYAEDLKVNCRILINPVEENLRKRGPYRRYTRFITKILSSDTRGYAQRQEGIKPSVIGYKIDKTSSLEFMFTRSSIEEILKGLLKSTRSWLNHSTLGSEESYVALTICQSLRDILLYILTEDLYSSISRFKFMGKLKDPGVLRDLTRIAISYSEIAKPLCQLLLNNKAEALKNLEDLLSTVLIELRDAVRKTSSSTKGGMESWVKTRPYIVTLLYGGKGVVRSFCGFGLNDEDIIEYVSNLIGRLKDFTEELSTSEDWLIGLLRFTASHTYTHHVIKHISLSSGLTIEFLGEHIDIDRQGTIESFIYENVSGGIAAIERALASWGLLDDNYNNLPEDERKQNRIESLLLRLGECVVGTPEDHLYMDSLGIKSPVFMTPLERSEYQKLKNVFNEEVMRFSKIWDLNSDDLLKEVIQLLHESDMRFTRFSSYDDVLLYYILSYDKWDEIGKLITKVLSKVLKKIEVDIESILINLHSYVGDSREEKLDDLNPKELNKVLSVMKSILIRLIPRACNPSCAMCYYSQKTCEYSNPDAQKLLLNRRLLKLLAVEILKRFERYYT